MHWPHKTLIAQLHYTSTYTHWFFFVYIPGRVTEDVIRSMIICQDLLHCDTVFIIHHTDCGGQNVLFCAQAVGEHVKHKAKEVLGLDTEGDCKAYEHTSLVFFTKNQKPKALAE